MFEYRGITWNHPRGYRALEESTRIWWERGVRIQWDKQPLERFESARIEELCALFDLVVFDHPHIGEAAEFNCLSPLEEWLPEYEFRTVREKSIGPALASYFYAGKHWALPLDAATQVLAYRPDLLGGEKPPCAWPDMRTFAERFPMGLSLAGPHALLSLFSICVAHGEPPLSRRALISSEVGVAALELMSCLFHRMETSVLELNPIGILEIMSRTNRIACCPLIYGYVNYAAPSDSGCHTVKFVNAPIVPQIGRPGSTLGGAGIGISRRTKIGEGLIAYLTWLLNEQTQIEFVTAFDGQPSLLPAWIDPGVNRRWNDFYQDTAETVKQAWVRPRYPGYIVFQNEGSEILRQSLCDKISAPEILRRLENCFNHHHPHDREV
jgi:multiple sugar transport system substrate-binding protein